MAINVFPAPAAGGKEKRVQLFTATGAFVAPAGVTYVISRLVSGGGGGGGSNGNGSSGGSSSFSTNTHLGGRGGTLCTNVFNGGVAGLANTGNGGGSQRDTTQLSGSGADSTFKIQGIAVVPGTSYTVIVGAGGAGGSSGGNPAGPAGGSGFVELEFYV